VTAYPQWLHILSWAYLILSFACTAFIFLDEIRRPQKMMIMNFVWPITALYFGPLAVWGYLKSGLKMTSRRMEQMHEQVKKELDSEKRDGIAAVNRKATARYENPSLEQIAVGVSHCGASCTLDDIAAEWWVFLMGLTLAGGVFETRILMDFFLAWAFGVAFQYFTIVPMRGLSIGKGLWQAIRADTLSIVAFEIGLFAWMALAYYVIFPRPICSPTKQCSG